ncbi:MAG: peptidoglycan-binding protein, partial [Streptomyces sp.]|nr:peptidoglycan-binding protein [Streptomyces sp.]
MVTSVQHGDRGPAVSAVQAELRAHGAALPVDGAFGAATHGAVVAFQARNKLPPDGVGGANTWLALVKRITEALVLADRACCRTPSGPVRAFLPRRRVAGGTWKGRGRCVGSGRVPASDASVGVASLLVVVVPDHDT